MMQVKKYGTVTIKSDFSKISLIQRSLLKKHCAQVGIIGKDGARKKGARTNIEIGAGHEFGEGKAPKRSFLKMPLETKLPEKSNKINRLLMNGIKNDSILNAFFKIGVIGRNIVMEAFASGGFGKWAPISDRLMLKKGRRGGILVDTQQLMESVTSRAK
jgi:hypothetical protein